MTKGATTPWMARLLDLRMKWFGTMKPVSQKQLCCLKYAEFVPLALQLRRTKPTESQAKAMLQTGRLLRVKDNSRLAAC